MKCLSALLILSLFFAPVSPAGESLTVRDLDGKSLQIRPISRTEGRLTFLRDSDGKRFSVPMERLDPDSRERISTWFAEGNHLGTEFDIAVKSGKSNRVAGLPRGEGKGFTLEPEIRVTNPDPTRPTRPATITTVFLGRPDFHRSVMQVLSMEEFKVGSLEATASESWKLGPVVQNSNKGSETRYLGYVVIVHDPESKQVYSCKSVPHHLAIEYGGSFLALSAGETYTESLEPASALQANLE